MRGETASRSKLTLTLTLTLTLILALTLPQQACSRPSAHCNAYSSARVRCTRRRPASLCQAVRARRHSKGSRYSRKASAPPEGLGRVR